MKTKRSTFKVLFYVKRTAARVSDGKAPVMARITIDGDIATFSAKLFVTPSLWNAEAGKVNGKSAEAIEINPQLEEIKARINNPITRYSGRTILSLPRKCATPF